ncbi:NFATC2-interacting protein [Melanotaenia boesemani]|uniref:NFATC2-interacting protein n=1 Tax=Melanotaenia boesemani TaxID=1250792 RepID=UPI001C046FBA|nr:NFATC2-interacting protein [Melanotaenia boesemani]
MAEAVSNSDVHTVKPPPKRRRILHPSAIKPVQVYSNKVSSSLHLKPSAGLLTEVESSDDGADLWAEFSSQVAREPVISLSDSEDDAEPRTLRNSAEDPRCPSPPPLPESPVQKRSRKVTKTIKEVNRRLRAVSSILSPENPNRRSRYNQTPPSTHVEDQEDDDVVIVIPDSQSSLICSNLVREIPLKIRCRTDIHKIPVLLSTQLSEVVSRLSVILDVPPPRLLLLRQEEELSTDSTVGELGLGIADIIECVVMAAEDNRDSSSSIITVRLQGKDRDSSQEFSIHREAPLDSIFSQYLSNMSTSIKRKVRFHYDGFKVTGSETPAQLDMEDGDIIEVWI